MALFRLTRYGRREWLGGTAVAAAGCGALAVMARLMSPLCLLPAAGIVLLWLWMLWFFRDPDRALPAEEGVFLSPADGMVTDVTAVGPDDELGTDGVKVGVFMSVFSVHVNRAPCDGRVDSIEHRSGAFLDARRSDAGSRNESATIRLAHGRGGRSHTIVIRQVAGLIARRIITDLTEGQDVRRGQRIGMIKFGSRLELLVPRELVGEVRVSVGAKAVAGRTILVAAPKEPGNETDPAD